MHYAMARRNDSVSVEHPFATPGEEMFDCPSMAELGASRPRSIPDHAAIYVERQEARLGEKPFQLTAQQRPGRLTVEEHRELEAREASIFAIAEPSIGWGLVEIQRGE